MQQMERYIDSNDAQVNILDRWAERQLQQVSAYILKAETGLLALKSDDLINKTILLKKIFVISRFTFDFWSDYIFIKLMTAMASPGWCNGLK